ncbi:MAG: helix-turn-helix domain-containing protein [Mucilaginibacter sp.]|uniref:AraC family transcriptional regulator n=1 Tax=Mucilaginibacter sp. TaxID=1882438 RepID=UPI00319F282F
MKDKGLRKREGFEGQKLIVLPKKVIADFLTKDPVTRQIYITDIGYYPKAAFHYAERPAGISQYIIIYCTEGTGWLEINKRKITVVPSEFIIIPANVPHRYGAGNDKPWTIYWVHFKGELSAYISELILNNSDGYKPNLSYSDHRIRLFDNIYKNLERGYSTDVLRYVNMIFSHFLSSLIYEEKFNDTAPQREKNVVSSSIRLMQEKVDEVIKLSDFAKASNLSVSHFSAIFKAETGYSPIEYFNHLKIQKSCQFLSFTQMPVKEIALSLGITDQYYFSRIFTRLMGLSPSNYRKKNNAGT